MMVKCGSYHCGWLLRGSRRCACGRQWDGRLHRAALSVKGVFGNELLHCFQFGLFGRGTSVLIQPDGIERSPAMLSSLENLRLSLRPLQLSKMLVASPQFNCSNEILSITAMLSGRPRSFFLLPLSSALLSHSPWEANPLTPAQTLWLFGTVICTLLR